MSVFDDAINVLFDDPNMAHDALYTPPNGGAPVPCRATLSHGDHNWRYQDVGTSTPARIAEIRASEVGSMKEEGTLAIGGQTYAIQSARRPDPDRLLWRLELA
ncbi:head-tail joining protein [Azospirillum brasilense]|uniref:Uncharacterized protein n=1 Tax=Azospirillum brasilense TaxID=192 RepID=A0A235H9S1_AZOBR|nr:hypothetical protein [Azospirillum brasilense]OYD82506.1 hypothetical protein CHT98_20105 [Azospirillum brasilense]